MKVIYHAENVIDANLVKHLVEEAGMLAFVNGGYLQGGVGELPASGLVTVSVADEDEAAARAVVRDFEREQRTDEDTGERRRVLRDDPLPGTG